MDETIKITGISTKRIKTLSVFIDENNIPEGEFFKLDFQHKIQIVTAINLVFFDLKVWFSLPDDNRTVLNCVVQNIFEIPNIKEYIQPDGQINLPNQTLVTIVSLAISHTRALLSIHTAGTVFQDTLIPVLDPVKVTMQFFKDKPNVDIYMPANDTKIHSDKKPPL